MIKYPFFFWLVISNSIILQNDYCIALFYEVSSPFFVINLHIVTLQFFIDILKFSDEVMYFKEKKTIGLLVSAIIYTVSCWFLGKMTYKIMGEESRISLSSLFIFICNSEISANFMFTSLESVVHLSSFHLYCRFSNFLTPTVVFVYRFSSSNRVVLSLSAAEIR